MPAANVKVAIIDLNGCAAKWFSLDHNPHIGEELALKSVWEGIFEKIEGVYSLLNVRESDRHLAASGIHWEVGLLRVRDLLETDQPISVGLYD